MNKKLKAGIKRFFSVLLICILTALIPSFYFLYSMHSNKCNDLRREIARLEKEKVEAENERKLERFKGALDNAVAKYGVSEEDVFSRLEDAGISVEEILSISNPNLLIKGVLSDKIQEVAKQNQISEIQNMKGLVEDKNETAAQGTKVTIESLLKSDLAEYKKNNYFD
jgi:hypothetical protein